MGMENYNRKFIVNEKGETIIEKEEIKQPKPKIFVGKGENKKEVVWDEKQGKVIEKKD